MNLDQYAVPRARKTDPVTSHLAAEKVGFFRETHAAKIANYLRGISPEGATAKEIAEAIGLTVVQVDRRTVELQRAGLIQVRQVNGDDLTWQGFRVWEAV